ncbi:MAG: T9SS type A sorting domain-containing protein [Bacteroidales bacterium]|nr:T9SS type A sorting domain-containing protein [Bacteroidales bacterium]
MKRIIYLLFFAGLLLLSNTPGEARSQPVLSSGSYTLYPPLNFGGNQIECSIYLYWQKPQLPGGSTPDGLVGYYIYRDGSLIHYVGNPDSLMYYDCPDPVSYVYTITANYDLTSYGFPGVFEQSEPAGPLSLSIAGCIKVLPFSESWDNGTFAYNDWKFISGQENWGISTSEGNPAPTAIFSGTPSVTNYSILMQSPLLAGIDYECARMYLDFDYKIDDLLATGTEKLSAEYSTDSTWIQLLELKNQGSTGWTHLKTEIPSISKKNFKIGFKAMGDLSSNITNWSVDNIVVTAVCKDPIECTFSTTKNAVILSWNHACANILHSPGYYVYRTDSTGNPPFTLLTNEMIYDLTYQDSEPANFVSGIFKYIITAVYFDDDNIMLCASPGLDTISVNLPLGFQSAAQHPITITPNPAKDYIVVKSDIPLESVEIYNNLGQRVLLINTDKQSQFTVPVSHLITGIYLISVTNANGKFLRKILINR